MVALAEGLQTSFYRLDAAGVGHEFRWLTVDLPPMIELRRKLLPPSERVEMCAQSALDFSWMDRVDTDDGVFITAEGLLMYLQPDEALALIAECAERFPGGRMMFDLPPSGFAGLVTPRHAADLAALPGAADAVQPVGFGGGKPRQRPCPAFARCTMCRCHPGAAKLSTPCCGRAQRIPLFDSVRPVITLLEFG